MPPTAAGTLRLPLTSNWYAGPSPEPLRRACGCSSCSHLHPGYNPPSWPVITHLGYEKGPIPTPGKWRLLVMGSLSGLAAAMDTSSRGWHVCGY